jgi:hypothetical protein
VFVEERETTRNIDTLTTNDMLAFPPTTTHNNPDGAVPALPSERPPQRKHLYHLGDITFILHETVLFQIKRFSS